MNLNRVVSCSLIPLVLFGGLAMKSAQAQAPAMTTVPAYYLSEFEVTDLEGIKPYSARVESTFMSFGGRYIARGGQVVSLEGEPAKRVVMIAFPSMSQARAWYDSPAYRALRPVRQRSARSRVFIVDSGAASSAPVETNTVR